MTTSLPDQDQPKDPESAAIESVRASKLLRTALKQLEEMANAEAAAIVESARELEGKFVADKWQYDPSSGCWVRPKL